MKIHYIILVTFIGFLVIFLLFGIDKIDANGWSVTLGVLVAGIITMLSTILNNIIESQRKEKESIETVRRDAQNATVELFNKYYEGEKKDVKTMSEDFKEFFNNVLETFQQKKD